MNSLAIDGGVDRYTCRTPHFHMYSHSTEHSAQMTCVQRLKTSCAPKKTFLHPRVTVHSLLHATLSTSSPSLPSTSPVLLSSCSPNPDSLSTYPIIHCEDPRQVHTPQHQVLKLRFASKELASSFQHVFEDVKTLNTHVRACPLRCSIQGRERCPHWQEHSREHTAETGQPS